MHGCEGGGCGVVERVSVAGVRSEAQELRGLLLEWVGGSIGWTKGSIIYAIGHMWAVVSAC